MVEKIHMLEMMCIIRISQNDRGTAIPGMVYTIPGIQVHNTYVIFLKGSF